MAPRRKQPYSELAIVSRESQSRVALCNNNTTILIYLLHKVRLARRFRIAGPHRLPPTATAPSTQHCPHRLHGLHQPLLSPLPLSSPQLPLPLPPLPPHPPLTRRPQGAGSASGNRLRGRRAGRVRSGARSDAFERVPALRMQRRPAASTAGGAVAIGWIGGPADWDSWQWWLS